jgi:hypothetical protein
LTAQAFGGLSLLFRCAPFDITDAAITIGVYASRLPSLSLIGER